MTERSHERVEALRDAVKRHFGEVSLPASYDIALHDCDECRGIRATFGGRSWQSLRPEELEKRFDSLPLLTPNAFRYYIPAYLLYSLEHLHPDSLVCQFTVYALAPEENEDLKFDDWWRERMRPFSREQQGVVEGFLDVVSEDPEFREFYPMLDGVKERLRSYCETDEHGPFADCSQ